MNEKVSPLTRLMDIYGSTSKIATKLEVDRQVVDGGIHEVAYRLDAVI